MFNRTIIVSATMLLFTSMTVAAPRGRGEAKGEQVEKHAALKQVVDALVAEVEKEWPRNETWPRKAPTFAGDSKIELSNDEVMLGLGHKLHDDPAMDAYIKWQLLSFEPDFRQADADDVKRVVRNLPAVFPRPQPIERPLKKKMKARAFPLNNQQPAVIPRMVPFNAARNLFTVDPDVGVVSSGTLLDTQATVNPDDPRYVQMTVRAGNTQLVRLRRIVDTMNVPVAGVRDAVIEQLPEANGMKLAAAFQDMADRLNAGDPSHTAAAKRFVLLAQSAAKNRYGDRGMKRRLADELQDLYGVRYSMIRSVEAVDDKRFRVERDEVRLSSDDFKAARAALLK